MIRACKVCGCNDDMACMTLTGPCHWVKWDLCSDCSKPSDEEVKWERFFITIKKPNDKPFLEEVDGEEIFTYEGYRFFMRWDRNSENYVMSDVRCGVEIARSEDYEEVLLEGAERITNDFTGYLNKIKQHAKMMRGWAG
jgi:hypothetical protein